MRFNLKSALLTASALVVVGAVSAQAADLIVGANDEVELLGDGGVYSAADSIVFSANDDAPAQVTLIDDEYHFNNVSGTGGGEYGNIIRIVGDGVLTTVEIHGDVTDNSADGRTDARVTFELDSAPFPVALNFSGANAQIDADITSYNNMVGNVYFTADTNQTMDFRGQIGTGSSAVGTVSATGDGIVVLNGDVYADYIEVSGEYVEDANGGLQGGAMLFGGDVHAASGIHLENSNGSAVGFGFQDEHVGDQHVNVYAAITTSTNGQGTIGVMGGGVDTRTAVVFRGPIGTAMHELETIGIENNAIAGFLGDVYASGIRFVGQDPDTANDEQGVVQVADGVTLNSSIYVEGNAAAQLLFEENGTVNGSIFMDDGFAIDLSNPLNPVSGRLEIVADTGTVTFDGGASGHHNIYGQFAVVATNGANVELLTQANVLIDGVAQVSTLGGGHLLLGGYYNQIGSRFDNTSIHLLNGQIKVGNGNYLQFGGGGISNVMMTAMALPGHTDALIDATGAMVQVHADTTVNLNIAGVQDGQVITVIGGADAASDIDGLLADGRFKFVEGGLLSHDTSLTDDSNLITTLKIKDAGSVIGGVNSGVGVGAANALIALQHATGDLAILRDKLLNAKTAEEAQQIAESISPNINGAAVFTAIQAAKQALGTTKIRIADLRAGQAGMAAGDGSNTTGAWMQAYGQSANQKNRGGIDGYKTSTYGFAVGADAEVSDNALIGAAFSYANSDVKSQNVNRTKLDIDSYQFSVYGNYDLGMQAYVSGVVGYAFNKADQTRHNVGMIAGATATSHPDSNQFSAYVEGGKTFGLGGGLNVTPNVSANYQYVSVEGHTERGFGGLHVNGYDRNMLELGVGATLAMTHQMTNGATLTPSLDVGYRHDVLDDDISSTGSFTGGGAAFSTNGLKPARGTFNVGVGVSYDLNNQWTLDAGYDFETKSEYRAHAGLIRAGYKF